MKSMKRCLALHWKKIVAGYPTAITWVNLMDTWRIQHLASTIDEAREKYTLMKQDS